MKKHRKRTEDDVSFQITPMIDMTFLLLIFFMVTSKLSKEQRRMDIRLPVASAAVIPADLSNRDVLNIDERGDYYIGERKVGKGELKSYLVKRFRANPPLRLYIRADREMPARQLRELMGIAADAGAIEILVGSLQREP